MIDADIIGMQYYITYIVPSSRCSKMPEYSLVNIALSLSEINLLSLANRLSISI